MRRTLTFTVALLLAAGLFCCTGTSAYAEAQYLGVQQYTVRAHRSTRNLENRYLKEARQYRAQGRYELARQSYAQALSICTSESRIPVIRKELEGIELLLRTMR